MKRIVPFTPGMRTLRKSESSRRAGVCKEVLNRWIQEGKLAVVARPDGLSDLVLESSLDELLERMRATATV